MQLQTKASLLIGGGSVCLLIGALSRALQIPDAWRVLPLFAGLVLMYAAFQLQKRVNQEKLARRRFGKTPLITAVQRRKIFLTIAVILVIGSIIFLFLMPYIVDEFWPGMYLIIIPLQTVFVLVALTSIWKKFFKPPTPRR